MERLERRDLLACDVPPADTTYTDMGRFISDNIMDQIQAGFGNAAFGDFAIPLLADRLPAQVKFFQDDVRSELESRMESLDCQTNVTEEIVAGVVFDVLETRHGMLGDLANDGISTDDVQATIAGNGDISLTFKVEVEPGEALSFPVPGINNNQLGMSFLPIEVSLTPNLNVGAHFEFEPLTVSYDNASDEFSYTFDSTEEELSLGLSVSLEDTSFEATFGIFEGVTIVDQGTTVGAELKLDIDTQFNQVEYINSEGIEPVVDLHWQIEAGIHAFLPSVRFQLTWSASGDTWSGDGLRIENFEVGLGSVISKVLAPIMAEIEPIIDPIAAVVEYADKPIPVISEIVGADYTLLSAMDDVASSGLLSAEYEAALKIVRSVLDAILLLDDVTVDGGEVYFSLGDYRFTNDNLRETYSGAFSVWDPDNGPLSDLTFDDVSGINFSEIAGRIKNAVDSPGVPEIVKKVGNEIALKVAAAGQGVDVEFPFLSNPRSLLSLALGRPQDVEIIRIDAAIIEAGSREEFEFDFPYFRTLKVGLHYEVDPKVNLQIGYDAVGIINAVKSKSLGGLVDGIFIDSSAKWEPLGDLQPIVGVSLGANFGARLSTGGPFFDAGVSGDVDVDLALEVPGVRDAPGKVRLTDGFGENSLGPVLFNVNGGIGGSIKAEVVIGVKAFGKCFCHKKTWTLAELNTVEFGLDAIYNPFYVAEEDKNFAYASNGTLFLNMGQGNNRNLDSDSSNETFHVGVTSVGGVERFVVTFGNIEQVLMDTDIESVNEIFANGDDGNDVLIIDEMVSIPIQFYAGPGDDVLIHRGSGPLTFFGGDGNDTAESNGSSDEMHGGPGDDILVGTGRIGAVDNRIFGDAGNDEIYANTGNIILYGGQGVDDLYAGPGEATLYGGAGNDRLFGSEATTTMFGEFGLDQYFIGSGNSFIFAETFSEPMGIDEIYWESGSGSVAANSTYTPFRVSVTGNNDAESFLTANASQGIAVFAPNDKLLAIQNPLSLSIDGLGGRDTITVEHLEAPTLELVAINGSDSLDNDEATDEVFVHGSSEADLLTVSAHDVATQTLRYESFDTDGDGYPDQIFYSEQSGATMFVAGMDYLVSAMINANDDLQLDTFGGNDDVSVYSSTGRLQINTHGGDDAISFFVDEIGNEAFGNPLAGYFGTVHVDAGSGSANLITVGGQRSNIGDNFQLSESRILTNQLDLRFVGEQFLTATLIGTQADDQFRILSTLPETFNLIFAGGGDDVARVHRAGRLNEIRGPIVFNGEAGVNRFQLSDRNATSGNQNVELTETDLLGFPLTGVTGFVGNSDEIAVGSANAIVELLGANFSENYLISAPSSPYEINAGGGNDRLTVAAMSNVGTFRGQNGDDRVMLTGNLGLMTSQLNVAGNDGDDRVNVSDSLSRSGRTYSLTESQFTRGQMVVQFDATLETFDMTGTPSRDVLNVDGIPNATEFTVDFGMGSDLLVGPNVGSRWSIDDAQNGNLDETVFFENALQIVGGNERDVFLATPASIRPDATPSKVAGGFGDAIDTLITPASERAIINLNSLLINEVFAFEGIDRFDGRHNWDRIIGQNAENKWHITGTDTGHVLTSGRKTRFANIESLVGGTQTDTFLVRDGGAFTGNVHGGLGADWLNYSFYPKNVFVDLAIGEATGINNVISVENVRGSEQDDRLFGNQRGNILRGEGGNDVILGRVGNDLILGGQGRDLMIGGENKDGIFGSTGEDILIGGTTTYDSAAENLDQIMLEWTREGKRFDARVQSLQTGEDSLSRYKLAKTVVVDDEAYDRLYGQENEDWLFDGDGDLLDQGTGRTENPFAGASAGNAWLNDDTSDDAIIQTFSGFTVDSNELEILEPVVEDWSWTNPKNAYDVNGDSVVSALDVLLIINRLKHARRSAFGAAEAFGTADESPRNFYDVNGDGKATALDALLLINELKNLF